MSYILDALRKSERERQQNEPLVLNPIGADPIELPRRRVSAATGLTALVLAAVAAGAYWIFATRSTGVVAPVVPPPALSSRAVTVPVSPSSAPVIEAHAARKVPRPAPELKPSPFVSAHSRRSVRDLAQEAKASIDVAAPPPKKAVAAIPRVATIPAPASAPASDSVRFLRAMPAEFRRAIPDLKVTIHIFAPREADRILYINNRQYHAGDRINGDIIVEDIVEDGAVLSYHGERFKLPRPT